MKETELAMKLGYALGLVTKLTDQMKHDLEADHDVNVDKDPLVIDLKTIRALLEQCAQYFYPQEEKK